MTFSINTSSSNHIKYILSFIISIATNCNGYVGINQAMNFYDAEAYCNAHGSSLASIHSAADNAAVQSVCVNDLNNFWCVIGINRLDGSWGWSDHSSYSYSNWWTVGNHPNSGCNGNDCAFISYYDDESWHCRPCTEASKFICNSPFNSAATSNPTSTANPTDLPTVSPTLNPSTSSRYFSGQTKMTFNEAEAYCNSFGSTLASVHSVIDHDLSTQICVDECWLGLFRQTVNSKWTWKDGSVSDYGFDANGNPNVGVDPWYSGEPNNSQGNGENCLQLWRNGLWNDNVCSVQLFPLCNGNPTTGNPTNNPSKIPTNAPTNNPTKHPTNFPTKSPTLDGCDFDINSYLDKCYCGINSHSVDSNSHSAQIASEVSDDNNISNQIYVILSKINEIKQENSEMMNLLQNMRIMIIILFGIILTMICVMICVWNRYKLRGYNNNNNNKTYGKVSVDVDGNNNDNIENDSGSVELTTTNQL
eukprot:468721_1